MKYECIETFSFENCCFGDDDKAEEYMTVVAGSVWQKTDDSFIKSAVKPRPSGLGI